MNTQFQRVSTIDRIFNRVFGSLVRLGAVPAYNRILEVRGRKSGKLYTTPVYLMDFQGKQWLVGPRGHTQWSRNAEAAGEVTLARGGTRQVYGVRVLPVAERAPVLQEYLNRYASTVQRFFSVKPGAALDAFVAIAENHPVFELTARPS
jgi:deazaflavin-dependent oxidoreductase (nitroreductase family)